MVVRLLKSLPAHFDKWELKKGEAYKVHAVNPRMGKDSRFTAYLIQGTLPLTVYENEVEVLSDEYPLSINI